ncbi:hypothetical protein [Psychromonas hadalis]|uniref:hypothetical protein n=1 Tax=Psychromonas hadalis TaxID=211669 RepID=UPI0003B3DA5B|nr:hypothetical protein [Psychromonas hadalis]
MSYHAVTADVASRKIADIHAIFAECNETVEGRYQQEWSSLRTVEREAFCKVAGLKVRHVNMSLREMDIKEREQLLIAIKSMSRVSALFADADVGRIKGFN